MDRRANDRNHDTGRQRACARQPEQAAPCPDGDDDECDLNSLPEHDFECGYAAYPVESIDLSPLRLRSIRVSRVGKAGVFVMQSDNSDRPQDGLTKPAQAKQERERADDELQRADWNDAHQGA